MWKEYKDPEDEEEKAVNTSSEQGTANAEMMSQAWLPTTDLLMSIMNRERLTESFLHLSLLKNWLLVDYKGETHPLHTVRSPPTSKGSFKTHCQARNSGEIQWISKQKTKGKAKGADLKEEQ